MKKAQSWTQRNWAEVPVSMEGLDAIREEFGRQMKRVQNLTAGGVVQHETTSQHTLKPLHLQGDMSMYSDDNFVRRCMCKMDVRVLELVDDIWHRVPHEEMIPYGNVAVAVIDLRTYVVLMLLIGKMLRPNEYDATLLHCIQSDWERLAVSVYDRTQPHSPPRLICPVGAFADSLLELADIWTTTADVNEYILFLTRLRNLLHIPDKPKPLALDPTPLSTPARFGPGVQSQQPVIEQVATSRPVTALPPSQPDPVLASEVLADWKDTVQAWIQAPRRVRRPKKQTPVEDHVTVI